MPRYFAAAAAKLVTLRDAPFATGRPVCPLRRVEAVLTMLFTPATYLAPGPKQEFCEDAETRSGPGQGVRSRMKLSAPAAYPAETALNQERGGKIEQGYHAIPTSA